MPAARFQGLYFTEADSKGRTQTHDNVFNNVGGNDQLEPETAETVSFGVEWTPDFLSGLRLKATWSDTDIENRIAYLRSVTGIDPNNLPTNVIYIAAEDAYIRDERWVNVGNVLRTGMDYELGYQWDFAGSELSLLVRHSRTSRFDVQPDAANPEVQSIVTIRDDFNNDLRTTLPPVPKHQTNAQLVYERAGFSAALDVQTSARTSTLASGGGPMGTEYVTDPPTVSDLVLTYDFGLGGFDAGWARDLRTTLTVNNLTNKFADSYSTNLETGEVRNYQFNPTYEWTQGRAYRLALRKSF